MTLSGAESGNTPLLYVDQVISNIYSQLHQLSNFLTRIPKLVNYFMDFTLFNFRRMGQVCKAS